MTQDEIIRMAREADIDENAEGLTQALERFAALVAAHERESCAKVCEEMWAGGYGPSAITAAIRIRGEK